jgi:hypothetical protein
MHLNVMLLAQTWTTAGFAPVVVAAVVAILWLGTLVDLLRRTDIDPVTRLTWVIVVLFLNLIGAIIYVIWGPQGKSVARPAQESDTSGTPWENDPGHRLD